MSFDSPGENAAFHRAESLPYPLWSDGAKALAMHYGVINVGMQPFASRVTLILNPKGEVVERFPNETVSPAANEHSSVALDALKKLQKR